MKRSCIIILLLSLYAALQAQMGGTQLQVKVLANDSASVLPQSTVQLLKADGQVERTQITDSIGRALFLGLQPGVYSVRVTRIDQIDYVSAEFRIQEAEQANLQVRMQPASQTLGGVSVTARKPMVQFLPDRTVVNVDASISNAGTTVLEMLEKAPGVTSDKDGNISLKGKPGVLILIDGKPTQLAGMDLQNFLSGMSSSQVEKVELMDNPSARYDASGNGGIINIITKRNKQRGFNGNLSLATGYGKLPKNNHALTMNLREGRFNFFLTYSTNISEFMMDMYALRTYFDRDRVPVSLLNQPYYTEISANSHNLNTGFDFYLNSKTTLGLALNGILLKRRSTSEAQAMWLNPGGGLDSTIFTNSVNRTDMERAGATFNLRHQFNTNSEISADIDFLQYDITNRQLFENRLGQLGGNPDDASRGYIPSSLDVWTGKIDYSRRWKNWSLETGWKTSHVATDNLAEYDQTQGSNWVPDLGKSNHFLYTENIHAVYGNANWTGKRWQVQGGLRYEHTGYQARQLGNAVVKDSSFNRNYGNLFPSVFITWQADSSNSFTIRSGRRIDRPAFQKLNPFTFILNKYTFQQGNPYFQPQFTWNVELSHQFRDMFSTTLSYNLVDDYMSQVFYEDTSTNLIVYTEGNVGRLRTWGLSFTAQLQPASWWTASLQATGNHKRIEAMLWKLYKAEIYQAQFSINNQFRWKKGWGAELSGFFITRNQNDIQEVLEPTGQLAIGVSKQILKNKGSLRLTFRDVFYTQRMAGLTDFQYVEEYFSLKRDTRVVTLGFTWRFGKAMKQTARRNTGAAGEVMERID
jgi:outer membrane receptor protein involved in Fe transport